MGHFTDSTSLRDNSTVVRPVCSKCGAPMWLTRIQPDKPGFARRTLECPRCHHSMIEVIGLETSLSEHQLGRRLAALILQAISKDAERA